MVSAYDEEGYGYRVDLEVFSGPLDLLLYLIRQEEVEITDIPIARITDQYLQHLEVMTQINVNVAGEFLLMAATLLEIKSRMLLPRPEREGEEAEEDPRADLIRQLIEYKRYKDAARALAQRASEQALKFTRGAAAALGLPERQPEEDLPILLGEVTVWELLAALKGILSQTRLDTTRHIVLDERPASSYCNDLLDELRPRGSATLRELFDPAAGRLAIINAFLALLELIRRRRVRAEQAATHGEIRIVLLDDTPVAESELLPATPPPEPTPAEPAPVELAPAEAIPAERAAAEAPPPAPTAAAESGCSTAPPVPLPEIPLEEALEGAMLDTEVEDIFVPEVKTAREVLAADAVPEEALEAPAAVAPPPVAGAPPAAAPPVAQAPVPLPPKRPRRAAKRPARHKAQPAAIIALQLRRPRPASLLARLPRCRRPPATRGPVAVILATRRVSRLRSRRSRV